jgi:hypothetical protein
VLTMSGGFIRSTQHDRVFVDRRWWWRGRVGRIMC